MRRCVTVPFWAFPRGAASRTWTAGDVVCRAEGTRALAIATGSYSHALHFPAPLLHPYSRSSTHWDWNNETTFCIILLAPQVRIFYVVRIAVAFTNITTIRRPCRNVSNEDPWRNKFYSALSIRIYVSCWSSLLFTVNYIKQST